MVDINALRGIPPQEQDENAIKEKRQESRKEQLIEKGLERARPDLKGPQKEKAKEVLKQAINDPNMLDKTIEDLAFSVAESLQNVDDELSPEAEYFQWIEEGQQVIEEMTDNDITDNDIKHREDFLDNLDQRENDLKLYISLYQKSSSSKAKEKLEFLQKKLAKLLEIRGAIEASTKSKEEAERQQDIQEEERRLAQEYYQMLEDRKRKDDEIMFSDLEYKAALLAAETAIALAVLEKKSQENKLRQERLQAYMQKRANDMRFLHAIAPSSQIKDAYQKQQEMINLVKVANTSQQYGVYNEEEQIRRNICGAVLEYRRRDKEVPEKVLYKLGVKSFVSEYSMSEEILRKKMQNQSKEDIVKRINELRGRQNSSFVPKSMQHNRDNMQTFDRERFLAKMREYQR